MIPERKYGRDSQNVSNYTCPLRIVSKRKCKGGVSKVYKYISKVFSSTDSQNTWLNEINEHLITQDLITFGTR